MAETVLQQLASQDSVVAFKATENGQMANLFMALLGKMIVEAAQRGKPIQGIAISRPSITNSRLSAHIVFHGIHTSIGVPILDRRYDDVGEYVKARSMGLSMAMAKNTAFTKFLSELFEVLESFCKHKGWPYKALKVSAAFLDKDDNLIAELENGALPS